MIERLTGALLLSCLSGLAAALIRWCVNPWFLDEPQTYAFFSLVPLLAAGWWLAPRLPTHKGPRFWGGCSTIVFALACVPPSSGNLGAKVVVVGIDGGTWTVADKVKMPALEALQERGRRGVLAAEEPLFSPLLWSTLATGKRPEQHGIRGLNVRTDQATAARFWEVARDAGLTVGLYKWLVTWPPPSGDLPGFTVPAWLAGDASTHPEGLSWVKALELSNRAHRKRVKTDRSMPQLAVEGLGDGLRWSTLWAAFRFACMERLSPLPIRKREAFLRRLRTRIDRDVFVAAVHAHDPDLATFTIYVTDALSHTHWSQDGGRHVDGAYRLADEVLAEIVAQFGPSTTFLVLSDHGFRNAADGGGVHSAVPKTERLKQHLVATVGDVEVVRLGRKLIVTPEVPISDVAMEQSLGQLVLDGGKPLFRSEIYPGKSAWTVSVNHVPPESAWPEAVVGGARLPEFVMPGRSDEGEHDTEGIVVLALPSGEDSGLGRVNQVDVTPTILALLGLSVAEDMPGQSWVEETAPRVATHGHLAPGGAPRDAPVNIERLKQLGYVD
jgi:hypothetical protein